MTPAAYHTIASHRVSVVPINKVDRRSFCVRVTPLSIIAQEVQALGMGQTE